MEIPIVSRHSAHRANATAALEAKARQDRIVPVREAHSVARPATVPTTYVEQEYDELAIEQLREHAAVGEEEATKPAVGAAGAALVRQVRQDRITINAPLVVASRDRYQHVLERLGPFSKRKNGSRWGYLLCLVLLLLGDVAGLGGAAIAYGEVPALAIMQAISASVATVVAGMIGAEFKYLKMARERRPEDGTLPEELEPYRALLLGPLASRSYVVVASLISLLVAVFIALGIFALRGSVEGHISGMVFGALAIGIACGSWVNSFRYADAVADKIESARQDYQRELRTQQAAVHLWLTSRAERATERARLIRERHRLHGEAAAAKIKALKFEALRQSPDVVGHGIGTGDIGRKPRSNGKTDSKGRAS